MSQKSKDPNTVLRLCLYLTNSLERRTSCTELRETFPTLTKVMSEMGKIDRALLYIISHESASIRVKENDEGTRATLSNLYSTNKGQGHAKSLMEIVVERADIKGLDLYLQVRPYQRPRGLDEESLVEFYKKFGFERIGTVYPIFMGRKAKEKDDA